MSKLKHLATVLAFGGALTVGIAATASAAQATELYFVLGYHGNPLATWDQSSAPEATVGGQGQSYVAVTDGSDSRHGAFSTVEYLAQGLSIKDSFNNTILASGGDQVYSGSDSDPTFAPTAPGAPLALGSSGQYSLTITAIPEPQTWALMLTGVFGLGALLRARRGKALAAA